MRTIDATLQAALATGHFLPTFKLRVYRTGILNATLNVIKYKLTGTHLSVVVRGLVVVSPTPDAVKIILDRGIVSNGINYLLSSSKFSPISGMITKLTTKNLYVETTLEANLCPPLRVAFNGNASYTTVITSFCTAIGKTPVFKDSGASFWSNTFYPVSTIVQLYNAQTFFPLLKQKFLIFACDNGSEEILFYNALNTPGAEDAAIVPLLYRSGTGYFDRRYFLWKDESGVGHGSGTVSDPIHNLGFIKTGDQTPTIYQQKQPFDCVLPINLNYLDGDAYDIDGGNLHLYPINVIETFDTKLSPGWQVQLRQLEYFTAREGG